MRVAGSRVFGETGHVGINSTVEGLESTLTELTLVVHIAPLKIPTRCAIVHFVRLSAEIQNADRGCAIVFELCFCVEDILRTIDVGRRRLSQKHQKK